MHCIVRYCWSEGTRSSRTHNFSVWFVANLDLVRISNYQDPISNRWHTVLTCVALLCLDDGQDLSQALAMTMKSMPQLDDERRLAVMLNALTKSYLGKDGVWNHL